MGDTAATVVLTCADGHNDCSGRLLVQVRNCTKTTWSVQQLSIEDDERPGFQSIFNTEGTAHIDSGDGWSRALTTPTKPGNYTLKVTAISGAGKQLMVSHTFEISNPARDAAVLACDECNGRWGARGMLGQEGCLCRTTDGGKRCGDGSECEGKCVATDDGFRCSEFFTVFGCHSYLPKGWASEKVTGTRKAPHICVD